MSTYSEYFLNSPSNVVRLETIEISHPNFTQTYRIVRNAINGLAAFDETGLSHNYDYYPCQIKATSAKDDLDQELEITFGDLGDILPKELDAVFNAGLLGDDVAPHAGHGANSGVNDGLHPETYYVFMTALVAVPGTPGREFAVSKVYQVTDVEDMVNTPGDGFDHGRISMPFPAGVVADAFRIYVSPAPFVESVWEQEFCQWFQYPVSIWFASAVAYNMTGALPALDSAHGALSGNSRPGDAVKGAGFLTKPTITYRSWRSDDLFHVLDGPIKFEGISLAFDVQGCTIRAGAPRLNLVSTGESYTVDRFPMLRGLQ
jgi:hypothetical protein